MEVECIIKLGGSAITRKHILEAVIPENITLAADTIADVQGKCIVVHGAGSFGHFQASEYKVALGYNKDNLSQSDVKRVKEGFCKTRVSVTKLNHMVVKALVGMGLQAVGVSPCANWTTHTRSKVKQANIDGITQLLKADFIPVLHGDCVFDKELGCTILSGDTIVQVLCQHFKPKRVVFLSDIDGVYNRPPLEPGATLIPRIRVKEDGSIATDIATSHLQHDVTGGIQTKIASACSIVSDSKGAIPVFICKLGEDSAKVACCHGSTDTFRGTIVYWSENQ